MNASLFTAVKHGNKHALTHAVDIKNIDAKDAEHGYSLLGYAAYFGHKKIVRFLLKQGANINLPGGELNQTPLMLATTRNHHEIITCLLDDSNIDLNLIDAHGRNALMLAVLSKNMPAINALIDKTNLQHIDNFGDTVFHLSDDPTINDLLVAHLPHRP